MDTAPQIDTIVPYMFFFPNNRDHPTTWRPEYAAYMVEGTPGKPYGGLMAHFNVVESNMKLRYAKYALKKQNLIGSYLYVDRAVAVI